MVSVATHMLTPFVGLIDRPQQSPVTATLLQKAFAADALRSLAMSAVGQLTWLVKVSVLRHSTL